jgi:hypothetical protein
MTPINSAALYAAVYETGDIVYNQDLFKKQRIKIAACPTTVTPGMYSILTKSAYNFCFRHPFRCPKNQINTANTTDSYIIG